MALVIDHAGDEGVEILAVRRKFHGSFKAAQGVDVGHGCMLERIGDQQRIQRVPHPEGIADAGIADVHRQQFVAEGTQQVGSAAKIPPCGPRRTVTTPTGLGELEPFVERADGGTHQVPQVGLLPKPFSGLGRP